MRRAPRSPTDFSFFDGASPSFHKANVAADNVCISYPSSAETAYPTIDDDVNVHAFLLPQPADKPMHFFDMSNEYTGLPSPLTATSEDGSCKQGGMSEDSGMLSEDFFGKSCFGVLKLR